MVGLGRAPIVGSVIRPTWSGRSSAQRLGLAVLLALAACVAGWWLRPLFGVTVPFVVFCPAVLLAAWYGGLAPGLLTTGLTAVATVAVFEDPASGHWPGAVIRPLGFLLLGVAISLLSEMVHEARRQQVESLRRAAELIELRARLDDTVTALPEPPSVERMADVVLGQGCALLGAAHGTLAVLPEGASSLETVSALGYPPGVEPVRQIGISSGEPLSEAVRLKTPVVLPQGDGVALPLLMRGQVLGAISFVLPVDRRFRETDLPVLHALAYQAALAMESAHHYEREQAARRQAEAQGERHRFLAAANACLAGSLDYEANLREVCRQAVPTFAGACLVHLRDADDNLRLLAAVHGEPGRKDALASFGRGLSESPGFRRVLASRRPELRDTALEWMDAEKSALHQELEVGSSLAVPLVARDRPLGIVTFLMPRGGRAFGAEELELGRDLADRAAAAVDNAMLFSEAKRLNRVKDEFLALLSHELRTPLGSALVWLELLRAEPLEKGARRAVDMIQRSARQLSDLIDQLLDMSRTVAGKLSFEKQTTDLVAVVEDVVAAAAPEAAAKGVQLEANIERPLDRLWADPGRLRQALGNLVSNAIKFTPAGGTVGVRLEHAGSVARVQVTDTGAGIAADVLPYIFERFRLGDTKSTRAQGGLGIGLAIAQYISEQHEGTLRAASEGPGRGSVFTLDLPLRLPPGIAAPAREDESGRAPLAALRVLLVDDHQDMLHGLALGLAAHGAEVTPVSSVREALAALPRVRPHVVVSDLAMPEQDGYTLIDRIRHLAPEDGGLVPAVAVSASAGPADRRRALRSGYQEHVAKPVELSRLVATIERLAQSGPREGSALPEPEEVP
jgi:signal transduction histidine kinase/ActR/RegA family two-component response regulator